MLGSLNTILKSILKKRCYRVFLTRPPLVRNQEKLHLRTLQCLLDLMLGLAYNFASRIVTGAHLYPSILLELATERIGYQLVYIIAEGAHVLIHAVLIQLVTVHAQQTLARCRVNLEVRMVETIGRIELLLRLFILLVKNAVGSGFLHKI